MLLLLLYSSLTFTYTQGVCATSPVLLAPLSLAPDILLQHACFYA
jgi:hypothetical protein